MRIKYLLKTNSKCTSGQPGCKFQANSAATIASNKDGARKFGFLSIISPDVSLLQKNVYVRVFTTLPC